MKNILKVMLLVLPLLLLEVACGVKGDPIPPKIPSELGRGQPTYKGATEELAFPTVPPVVVPTAEDAKKKNKK